MSDLDLHIASAYWMAPGYLCVLLEQKLGSRDPTDIQTQRPIANTLSASKHAQVGLGTIHKLS